MSTPPPPPARGHARDLARGGGVLLLATLAGNALLLFLDVYLNGLLSPADYGLFGTVRRVAAFGLFVVGLGVENTILREVAASRGLGPRARGAVGFGLRATLATSVGAVLLGAPLVWAAVPAGELRWLWLAALATLPAGALRMVAVAAGQGLGVTLDRAVVMFVAWPLVQLALVALFVQHLGGGLAGAAGAWAGAMVCTAALATVLWRRRWARADVGSTAAPPTPASALWAASWPLWIQGMVMAAYTWLDHVALAGLAGAEAAGVYGPVVAVAPLFGVGLTALNGRFAPLIAERHAAGDHAGLAAAYRLVTRWALLLTLPPALVALCTPEVVLAVWPSASLDAAPALRLAALAQLGATLVGSVNYLLIMSGHPRDPLWSGLVAVGASLVGSLLFVPRFGVTGAALANLAATVAANGLGLLQVWRRLGLHPFDRALGWALGLALPGALVTLAAGSVVRGFGALGEGLVADLARGALVGLAPLVVVGLGAAGLRRRGA